MNIYRLIVVIEPDDVVGAGEIMKAIKNYDLTPYTWLWSPSAVAIPGAGIGEPKTLGVHLYTLDEQTWNNAEQELATAGIETTTKDTWEDDSAEEIQDKKEKTQLLARWFIYMLE